MTVLWLTLEFALCAAIILFAGVRLSRYGDIIAEKTGLGGVWIGVVLMATVTSLPELITGASAVVLVGAPEIAAGDAIGSCMFNLLILAFLDVRHPMPLAARVHQGQVLAAAFGIVQLALAATVIVVGEAAPVVGWVGVHSLLFFAVYVFAMRTIFFYERRRHAEVVEALTGDVRYQEETLRRAVTMYAVFAAVLVAAAAWLPAVGERLAVATGLTQSFVGSLFVAASTSLPEVAVSVAAARLGAIDMAAGNLFGSNLFNIAVLGVDDVLYTPGSFLGAIGEANLVTLLAAIMMTAIAIVGLTYRAQRKRFRLSWDSLGIVAVYAMAVLYLAG